MAQLMTAAEQNPLPPLIVRCDNPSGVLTTFVSHTKHADELSPEGMTTIQCEGGVGNFTKTVLTPSAGKNTDFTDLLRLYPRTRLKFSASRAADGLEFIKICVPMCFA